MSHLKGQDGATKRIHEPGGLIAKGMGYINKSKHQKHPLTLSQWKKSFNSNGTIPVPEFVSMLSLVSEKGVEDDAKPEVWPYLLGVFAPDMSTHEKELKLSCVRIEFGALMEACKEAEGQVTAIIAEQQAAAAAQQQQQQYAEARHSGAGGIQHKQEPQGISMGHRSKRREGSKDDADNQSPFLNLTATAPGAQQTGPETQAGMSASTATDCQQQQQQHQQQREGVPRQQRGESGREAQGQHGVERKGDEGDKGYESEDEAEDGDGDNKLPLLAPLRTDPSNVSNGNGNSNAQGQDANGSLTPSGKTGTTAIPSPTSVLSHEGPVPENLRRFWEAQRIIVMDAVRTDFKKNSLSAMDALISRWNVALANTSITDSQLYQRLSDGPEGWGQGMPWLGSIARHQLLHAHYFSSDQKRQVVRMVALLSAYAVSDPEIGYCQGMSDLALPFLLLMEDDALAFAAFKSFMQQVRRNFAAEGSEAFTQLTYLAQLLESADPEFFNKLAQVDATDCHFAYRMIMVLLRRELTLEQALELWEMLWADSLLHSVPCYRGLLQRMGTGASAADESAGRNTSIAGRQPSALSSKPSHSTSFRSGPPSSSNSTSVTSSAVEAASTSITAAATAAATTSARAAAAAAAHEAAEAEQAATVKSFLQEGRGHIRRASSPNLEQQGQGDATSPSPLTIHHGKTKSKTAAGAQAFFSRLSAAGSSAMESSLEAVGLGREGRGGHSTSSSGTKGGFRMGSLTDKDRIAEERELQQELAKAMQDPDELQRLQVKQLQQQIQSQGRLLLEEEEQDEFYRLQAKRVQQQLRQQEVRRAQQQQRQQSSEALPPLQHQPQQEEQHEHLHHPQQQKKQQQQEQSLVASPAGAPQLSLLQQQQQGTGEHQQQQGSLQQQQQGTGEHHKRQGSLQQQQQGTGEHHRETSLEAHQEQQQQQREQVPPQPHDLQQQQQQQRQMQQHDPKSLPHPPPSNHTEHHSSSQHDDTRDSNEKDNDNNSSLPPPALSTTNSAVQSVGRSWGLFIYFVAAVVLSQRKRLMEECWDADDVMRLYHGLGSSGGGGSSSNKIKVGRCMARAHQLRSRHLAQALGLQL
eukprot:CAMPEP_0202391902 /NCGR_PEP_ID=MMETSP1127-20130417/92085_1 /ASSEMBLY_ACC=CAM_ASM_000462 /TAXON_ID=3047 /ORGANISM="Dunaliella tertiolecta, Strain CCMP1320" /LENGTH=1088 /DNA_ID=CAMNT_0048994367 /DNA_START=117 /DNA_END=3383 /DNA_ORIENTATION=+